MYESSAATLRVPWFRGISKGEGTDVPEAAQQTELRLIKTQVIQVVKHQVSRERCRVLGVPTARLMGPLLLEGFEENQWESTVHKQRGLEQRSG